jgi:hypothetical protein
MDREYYEPKSDFLKTIVGGDAPLSSNEFADANLRQLIALTRDSDLSNRDWATMLLAQEDVDTPEVREALFAAAADEDNIVRAEAILGLAQRDRGVTLPLVKAELAGGFACLALFEAAGILAAPELVASLQDWTKKSDAPWLDDAARTALAACEGRPEN